MSTFAQRMAHRRAARRRGATLTGNGKEHRRELAERYASPKMRGAEEGADLFEPDDDEDDE